MQGVFYVIVRIVFTFLRNNKMEFCLKTPVSINLLGYF